jgi:hypothetical protein
MITSIYEGTNQTQGHGDGPPAAVPDQIGMTCATRDQMGVHVGGASAPISQCVLTGEFALGSAA